MFEYRSLPFVILIPVYNDWAAATQLLRHLDNEFQQHELQGRAILIDDGSSQPVPSELAEFIPSALSDVSILSLRRNLGHQRALAIGMCYIEAHIPCQAVIVMDGDGEDAPIDVPRLLARYQETDGGKVIFAERTHRSEKLTFRLFYRLYKGAHLLLTGERVRVGNFSVLPFASLVRLVSVSDLWNHYAAAVFKARIPYDMVPTKRGTRYAGESRMNFVSLVIHGLSAMAVYGDRIGVRLLAMTSFLVVLTVLAFILTLIVHFATAWAIPGWATYTTGLLMVMLLQMLTGSVVFVFVILAGRDSSTFLPMRDYAYFVQGLQTLCTKRPVITS